MIEIVKKETALDDDNKECLRAEIQADKLLLRNGAKHCRHFFIEYKTEEELQKILSEFEEGE